jgi:hypothetical protein
MELTREYYEAVRDCAPEDCGDCILNPETNRACHMVDVDPSVEAAFVLALMDERDRYREALTLVTAWLDNTRCRHDCATCEHLHSCGTYSAIAAARDALKPAQKEAAHAEAGQ